MGQQAKQIDGSEVKVGDLWRMGFRLHRITKLEDYPGIVKCLGPGYTARIARCDTGISITVIDGSPFEIIEGAAA